MRLRFALIFTSLFILTLPFEQSIIPNLPGLIAPLFESMAKWVAVSFLGWSSESDYRLASDSTGLYIHCGLLLILSSSAALIWKIFEKSDSKKGFYSFLLTLISSTYLSMHLFSYGFSKLFKVQFFFPEPNTLFTPLGQISHDLLFWSSMGSSYSYTVFSGILELMPAILLLFRRTRLLGSLIAAAVMTNVLMLNLAFDISVKLFSGILLFLSSLIISVDFNKLYSFFISDKTIELKEKWHPKINPKLYWSFKIILLLLLVINGLFPFIKSGNYNDDSAPRPYLHGAYEVEQFVLNGDSLAPLTNDKKRWRRIFIHRRSYFIVQNMQDKMKDFKLSSDKEKGLLILKDYDNSESQLNFQYSNKDSILIINGRMKGNEVSIIAKQLDLSKLPLSNPKFHWTVQ